MSTKNMKNLHVNSLLSSKDDSAVNYTNNSNTLSETPPSKSVFKYNNNIINNENEAKNIDYSKVNPKNNESVIGNDGPSIEESDILLEQDTDRELLKYPEIFEKKKKFSDKNPMNKKQTDDNTNSKHIDEKKPSLFSNIKLNIPKMPTVGIDLKSVGNTMKKVGTYAVEGAKHYGTYGTYAVEGAKQYGTPAVEKAVNVITTIKEYNISTTITDEKIKNMLMNKQRESIQTKTDIKDYFKNSTSGKYFYEYKELEQFLPKDREQIIDLFVKNINEILKIKNIEKKNKNLINIFKHNWKTIPDIHNPFKEAKYEDFVKNTNISYVGDMILKADTKPRALQQIVRLYKSELRNEIYRRLEKIDYKDNDSPCFRLGEGRLDMIDNGMTHFFKESCEKILNSKKTLLMKVNGSTSFESIRGDKFLYNILYNLSSSIIATLVSFIQSFLDGVNDTCDDVLTGHFTQQNEIIQQQSYTSKFNKFGKTLKTLDRSVISSLPRAISRVAFGTTSSMFTTNLNKELEYVKMILLSEKNEDKIVFEKKLNTVLMNTRLGELFTYGLLCSLSSFSVYGFMKALYDFSTNFGKFGMGLFNIFNTYMPKTNYKTVKKIGNIRTSMKKKGGESIVGGVFIAAGGPASGVIMCQLCIAILYLITSFSPQLNNK